MIDWTPSAVAIQLGPFPLYWYGIAYALGLAGAYAVMVRQARRLGENAAIIGNGLIVIAVAALIGGRLYHVVDQWQLYAGDPIKIILPPYSGLGVFGGFVDLLSATGIDAIEPIISSGQGVAIWSASQSTLRAASARLRFRRMIAGHPPSISDSMYSSATGTDNIAVGSQVPAQPNSI